MSTTMERLSLAARHRTSATVAALFDMQLRALRRDRAARQGPEPFLFERTFEDCLDRLSLVQAHFRKALLIGCPDPSWPGRLRDFADEIEVCDPGPLFAAASDGFEIREDEWQPEAGAYDLVLAIGTLDTINDLPRALLTVRWSMTSESLFIGAISGGETVPQLRGAMRAADLVAGEASPHVHPRIEPSALAPLLSSAGFQRPVVDVDRVAVSYRSLENLVADLRRMAATNVLAGRSRKPVSRHALAAAAKYFSEAGDGERTRETFEILHFACWTPRE